MARFYCDGDPAKRCVEINLDEIETAERNGGRLILTFNSGRTHKLTGEEAIDALSCIRSSRAKPRGPERTRDRKGLRIRE